MARLSLKLIVLGLAAALAASPGARASGLYDADDGRNLDAWCDKHPYADACDRNGHYDNSARYKTARHNGRCAALIRATGKRNLITAFARNSARFAWRREVRAVHGSQYSDWRDARNVEISCERHGLLKSCTARATPCRY